MSRSAEESIAYYSQFECVNRIHIVDLIGAKAQHAREFDYIKSLRRLTTKDIEVGGGIARSHKSWTTLPQELIIA